MTPNSSNSSDAINVSCLTAITGNTSVTSSYLVSPVVYLKNEVTITGGNGTSSNPYTLACSTC